MSTIGTNWMIKNKRELKKEKNDKYLKKILKKPHSIKEYPVETN
jgi:hypothetical protein